jgi:crotonobetainyl-CoA:carnitine CoA-transferase CaiB-like acyl-CoA transferase
VGFGDDVAMASGLTARDSDDDQPLPCGDAIADPLTGMHAAVHALASFRSGGSRLLDVAMSEVVAGTVAWSPGLASSV